MSEGFPPGETVGEAIDRIDRELADIARSTRNPIVRFWVWLARRRFRRVWASIDQQRDEVLRRHGWIP